LVALGHSQPPTFRAIARIFAPRFNGRMPETTRQKITFGEMRAAGVRGLLIYCADYHCSHGRRSAATDGAMMSGSRTSNPGSHAKRAAGGALMSVRISMRRRRPDARLCRAWLMPDAHGEDFEIAIGYQDSAHCECQPCYSQLRSTNGIRGAGDLWQAGRRYVHR
jgi:hypothetical protein